MLDFNFSPLPLKRFFLLIFLISACANDDAQQPINDILAKVLQKMKRLGYIQSTKGVRGGYRLNKKIEEISLIKFIEDIEGPIGLVNCSIDQDCMQLNDCSIRSPINQINNNIRDFFNKILIKDIMYQ